MTKVVLRKKRSSYPYYSVHQCIEKLQMLRESEGLGEVPAVTAFEKMGLSPSSSSADRAISAMLGYGLINDRGSRDDKIIWISELGKEILIREESEPQRLEALRKAALNDEMVRAMVEKWPNGKVSRDNIKRTLMLSPYSFTERAATRFSLVVIDTFENIDFGNTFADEDETEDQSDFDEQDTDESDTLDDDFGDINQNDDGYKISKLTLVSGDIVLKTPNKLSQDDYDFMLLWMKQLRLVEE